MLNLKERIGDVDLLLMFASTCEVTAQAAKEFALGIDTQSEDLADRAENVKKLLTVLDVIERELCIPIERSEWKEASKALDQEVRNGAFGGV